MCTRLDKMKEILIYLVIVFLPVMSIVDVFGKVRINMAVSDAFAALIMLLVLIDYKNFSLKRSFPYWWYFTGLIGLMVISNTFAYFNPNIAAGSMLSTINELIKFAIAGVYFFIGYNCPEDRDKLIKVLKVWTYTALVVSIIGIVIIFVSKQVRLVGTLTDPNLAATYLSVSYHISLLFIGAVTRKSDKYTGVTALIIIAAGIALTQSRSGIIGFIVSLLIYFVINIKKLYRYITIILLIVFIAYFGFLNLDAVYFNKQFTSTIDNRMEEMLEGKGEAVSRLNLTKSAFMMGKDNFLFGVGRGNYPFNSEQYHKKLGIDTTTEVYRSKFSILIPHNTYMAFFAELGILGLVLFLSIFFKVFRICFRRNSFSIIAICLFTFYLVQAVAVNLENFRGIWFILGLVMICNNKSFIVSRGRENESHKISTKNLYLWNGVLLLLSILTFLNAVPHYTNPVIFDNDLQYQDFSCLKPNEEYMFRYLIKTKAEDVSRPTSKITIYGLDKHNKEILLNQITHYTPNGYGNLIFVPEKGIRTVKIQVEPLDISSAIVKVEDASVVNTNTGEGQRVFAEYKYVPDSIETFMMKTGLIKSTAKVDTTSLNLFADKIVDSNIEANYNESEKTVYFDGNRPINLSNKVLFLGAKLEQQSEGQAKLSLIFKCIGKMDVDYNIWMHGATIDKGILAEGRRKYGFANWNHALKVKTADWQVGEIYEDTYIIDTVSGQYYIGFGFWNPKWKDGKEYRLYPAVELGNIQIKP